MKVMDIDAESHNSGKVTATSIEKKLERTVRCSSILIGALFLCTQSTSLCCTAALVPTEYRSPQPCVSEQCVETASRILQALNKDVDPCTDFYEFACGGWSKQNPIPDWTSSWNQFAKLQDQLDTKLRELLETKDDEGLPNSVVKTKSFYRMCMNTEKLEADGIKPIQKLLQNLGLPPRPPTEMSANFTWEEVAGRVRRQLGLNVLLGVEVTEDQYNNSLNRVWIDQVPPGFNDRYLRQPEKFSYELEQYHKYIRSMVSIADNETDAQQFADEIVDFSKKLADIMTPTHFLHYKSVQALQSFIGGSAQRKQHDWERYLNLVFSNTSVTLQEEEDIIIVVDLPYLQKLSVLLADTRPVVIERFLWWRVFSYVARMTLSAFRSLKFDLSHAMSGQRAQTPHWKSCIAYVKDNFGVALSYLYIKRHFDYTSIQKAVVMIQDVSYAFAAALPELDWMDSTTKLKTLDKLIAMWSFVGFPDWLLTHEKLDQKYENAEIVEGSFFETVLKLKIAAVKASLESLRKKPNRNRWTDTATTINAIYMMTLNSITIPAAILQPPFYGNGIEAINYGSIGAIMGHEVTHGFDNQGRRFDEEGNRKQWWSTASLEHYLSKVQCIIDQYSKYPMPQLLNYTVDGSNTQNENIADNGGLRAAFHAYQLFATRAPADKNVSLPGLPDYKSDQLFFLGFAQTWCGNSTVRALNSQMLEDVHSPNKIRVMGTLSNSKEFADAWSCPAGSPMNPEHKCELW